MSDKHTRDTPHHRPKAKRLKSQKQQVWLDNLPTDVCARIASFLPHILCERDDDSQVSEIDRTPPIIFLAESSPKQRFAVCLALKYHLQILHIYTYPFARDLVCRWDALLGHEIQKLTLPCNIGPHPEIVRMLRLNSLTNVSIPNFPSYTRAMLSGTAITDLSLDLTHYQPVNGVNPLDALPELLDSCRVRNLRLFCHGCPPDIASPCMAVERLCGAKVGSPFLKSLETLHLKCKVSHVKKLHRVMARIPNLRELTLEQIYLVVKRSPYDDADQRLWIWSPEFQQAARKVQSIRILHVRGTYELATRIGSSVTSIATNRVFSSEEVAQLHNFPNLTMLDIWVERGAEKSFPRNIQSLRSLNLRWYLGNDQAVRGEEYEDEDDSGSDDSEIWIDYESDWPKKHYYTAASRFLMGLVIRNSELEILRLKHVYISPDELEEVLERVGGNLRELELPLYDQGRYATDHLICLMRMIGEYNRGLSYFHSTEAPDHQLHAADYNCDRFSLEELTRDMEVAFRILTRRVPQLRGIQYVVRDLMVFPA